MDALFYRGLAAELDRTLRGLEVRAIEDPAVGRRSPEGLLVRFLGERGSLLVSLDRDSPGVFQTQQIGGTRSVRGVPQRLYARLRGALVRRVRQPALDRVLQIDLHGLDGPLELWLEMTGRLGNLALVDREGDILVVARTVFAEMSRVRRLEVDLPYVAPPRPPGENLLAWQGGPVPAEPKELARKFSGLLPRSAEALYALWSRAGLSPEAGLTQLVAALGGAEPLAPLPTGPESFTAAPRSLAGTEEPSFSAAAERAWRHREETLALSRKRGELNSVLRGRLAARRRLLTNLERDLTEAGVAERLRMEAEHLAAHLHAVRRGQTELICARFDGEGELRLALDPTRSPGENLEQLFHRARKAERGRDVVEKRCTELRSEIEGLDEKLRSIEGAAGWEALVELGRGVETAPAEDARFEAQPLPAGVSAFRSSDGLVILVGRGAQGNHTVSFELARPRDLWFHTRDYPGAHVVLRRASKKEPPARSVLEAAALAAHFSKASTERMVDVACCLKHQVKPVKGGPAGKAIYSGEKTIQVRMEPSLLEPVLGRRVGTESPG